MDCNRVSQGGLVLYRGLDRRARAEPVLTVAADASRALDRPAAGFASLQPTAQGELVAAVPTARSNAPSTFRAVGASPLPQPSGRARPRHDTEGRKGDRSWSGCSATPAELEALRRQGREWRPFGQEHPDDHELCCGREARDPGKQGVKREGERDKRRRDHHRRQHEYLKPEPMREVAPLDFDSSVAAREQRLRYRAPRHQ